MSVTIVMGKRQALAGFFLIVLGALVGGALGAPAPSQALTTYTRSASCAGLDFYPSDNDTPYSNFGPERITGATHAIFRCDPSLPSGATVIRVQFTIQDDAAFGQLSNCVLRRSGLQTTTAATAANVSSPVGTMGAEGYAPGTVRLTSTSISNGAIDNANFGYWLECTLDGPAGQLGVWGADVIYTITAAKG